MNETMCIHHSRIQKRNVSNWSSASQESSHFSMTKSIASYSSPTCYLQCILVTSQYPLSGIDALVLAAPEFSYIQHNSK